MDAFSITTQIIVIGRENTLNESTNYYGLCHNKIANSGRGEGRALEDLIPSCYDYYC
ncbi:hypothetical protein KSP40_PGU022373 [Platanthera guangdongensis]|uniref:Uncharacterized protein n=1 Tax=Platanthera guangdongensis TaxID=2320717 RepID=A0ABR2MF55_9ASPA